MRPGALAVSRLIASVYLSAFQTGRSPGFAPGHALSRSLPRKRGRIKVGRAVYAAPLKFCPRIGSERRRLPVAAKIALVTAGWIMVAPGSPTPPHRLPGVGEM